MGGDTRILCTESFMLNVSTETQTSTEMHTQETSKEAYWVIATSLELLPLGRYQLCLYVVTL